MLGEELASESSHSPSPSQFSEIWGSKLMNLSFSRRDIDHLTIDASPPTSTTKTTSTTTTSTETVTKPANVHFPPEKMV